MDDLGYPHFRKPPYDWLQLLSCWFHTFFSTLLQISSGRSPVDQLFFRLSTEVQTWVRRRQHHGRCVALADAEPLGFSIYHQQALRVVESQHSLTYLDISWPYLAIFGFYIDVYLVWCHHTWLSIYFWYILLYFDMRVDIIGWYTVFYHCYFILAPQFAPGLSPNIPIISSSKSPYLPDPHCWWHTWMLIWARKWVPHVSPNVAHI